MTEPRLLLPYFREIPKFLLQQRRVCIAGGAVLDLKNATDVDVYVMNCKEFPALDLIYEHLLKQGVRWSKAKSSDGKNNTLIYVKRNLKPVNIICVESRSIAEVLECFDISTSRWAVSVEGRLISIPSSTKPGEPIVVYHVHKSTPGRIEKYGARFGTGWQGPFHWGQRVE